MTNDGTPYVGVDVHEESQLAVLEKDGSLVMEERIPTKELSRFLVPSRGEARGDRIGGIHPSDL